MSLIAIHNRKIDPVIWENGNLCEFTLNTNTDIWQIDVSGNLSHINDFLKTLTPGEITRADRYLKQLDRDRFIISRGSLRNILSKYLATEPGVIQFNIEANKKPRLAGNSSNHIHFNLSDSADTVLIAISTLPLGIDVEFVNPKFRYYDIINHNFNKEEADYIRLENNLERFFLLWTRKEAILKATGVGLTEHLKSIPSLGGEFTMEGDLLSTSANWQLNSFQPKENYQATLATKNQSNNFRFWDFDLKKV